jgi:outer membrane protein assembly factor BamB
MVFTAGGVCLLTGGVALISSLPDKKVSESVVHAPAVSGLPTLKIPNQAASPSMIVKTPGSISQLPPAVPGPWKIDRLNFASDVVGPQETPHLLWSASIGGAKVVGFAPDETIYLWEVGQNSLISAIRNGDEQWAYGDIEKELHLDGIARDGRVWLSSGLVDGNCCLNSKGEGGWLKRSTPPPHDLLPMEEPDDAHSGKLSGRCVESTVALSRFKYDANFELRELEHHRDPIQLSGNCKWVIRDDLGKFYAGTDRGSVYCLSAEGGLLWKYEGGASTSSPPHFSLEDLIFASEDRLLSLREGVLRWNLPVERCRPAFPDKAGTMYVQYRGNNSRNVAAALDRDGNFLWRLETDCDLLTLDPQGRLYLGDGRSVVCAGV